MVPVVLRALSGPWRSCNTCFVWCVTSRSHFDGSRFDGSRFHGSHFDGSHFHGSRFHGSHFHGSRSQDYSIHLKCVSNYCCSLHRFRYGYLH
ncbi:MAG: hypothetical protein CBB67_008630 [Alteromonadaceae bacterium TMED7]|nr:MAG: hypothetical protein CBB67_008630 [Alteromonadaceae bacterium TMED7]